MKNSRKSTGALRLFLPSWNCCSLILILLLSFVLYSDGVASGKESLQLADQPAKIQQEKLNPLFTGEVEIQDSVNRDSIQPPFEGYKKEDLRRLIANFNEAIQRDRHDADAYFSRGSARYQLGDYGGAIRDYTQALEIDPSNIQTYWQRATVWTDQGDYEKAIEDYTQLLKLDSNNFQAYYERGNLYRLQSNYQIAIADYERAIRLNPKETEYYYYQGLAYYRLKQYEKAIERYSEALRLSPKQAPYIYLNRGKNYEEIGKPQKAIQDYSEAISINPDYSRAYYKRGNVRYKLGDKQGAIEDYHKALQINYFNAKTHYKRGKVRHQLGDGKGAIKDYTKAIRTDPDKLRKVRQKFLINRINFFATAVVSLIWIVSISFHEYGHAVVAYWGGDRSVSKKGYLSLNPLGYNYPLRSVIIPGFFLLAGVFPVTGSAVYVERQQLKNRFWQSAVSAGGPIASLLFALLLIVLFRVSLTWNSLYWVSVALAFFVALQLFFALLNLIPLPPLDGYGIIEPWLPKKLQLRITNIIRVRKFTLVGLGLVCCAPFLSLFVATLAFAIIQMFGVPAELAFIGFSLFNRWYCALLFSLFGIITLICQPQIALIFLAGIFQFFRLYKQALKCYDKAIQLNPNNLQILGRRGRILEKIQNYDQALACYNKVIQLKADNEWAWSRRGRVLEKLEHYEEALTSYEKAIELKYDNVWDWRRRAWILEKLQRYEEALSAFEQIIELRPDDEWVWGQRGWVLEELQRYEESLKAFDRAIELRPDDEWVWIERGWVLVNLRKYRQAVASYEKAIELKPDNQWVWGQRAWVLGRLEFYQEAIASYDKAIELKPDDDWAWYNRACIYALQGNLKLAMKNLQSAIELNPEKWQESAKNDSDFTNIREHESFKRLVNKKQVISF